MVMTKLDKVSLGDCGQNAERVLPARLRHRGDESRVLTMVVRSPRGATLFIAQERADGFFSYRYGGGCVTPAYDAAHPTPVVSLSDGAAAGIRAFVEREVLWAARNPGRP